LVNDPEPRAIDLVIVQRGLLRLLGARFPKLPDAEGEELADEAIARLIEQTRTGAVSAVKNPAAYLSTVARNLALDRMKKVEPLELVEDLPDSDDAIAALLDRDATAATVQMAMQAAIAAGDHLAVRVVAAWLDLAAERGEPTSREVAKRARTSHTTVNEAIRRFRGYFPEQPGQSSSE
jgi:DNA-directed RNA polymerase specialized sigma24 family protein